MSEAVTELRRLESLRSYGVIDSPPEPGLDRLTRLAAAICGTPIAVISLVDSQRQWFKSVHGVEWQSTERSIAFCHHAIRQTGLFVVEDARSDPRFRNNPLVCGDERLRFYAGMPLVTSSGHALGALAVMDHEPRLLDDMQREALETLAAQVMSQFEARRRQGVLEEALLQRERDQSALRESQDRWRLLFERNPLPMWVFDQETQRFLAVNDAAVVHYGWTTSEFLSMTQRDLRPADDLAPTAGAAADNADADEADLNLGGGPSRRHRKKNGETIHVDITAHSLPFEGREGRLVLAHDITERVQAETSLRLSEERWERLFAASATGIASAGADGRMFSANPAFCELLGRSEPELLGSGMFDFTHPDDVAGCRHELDRLLSGEIESATIEKRYLRADGRAVWARAAIALTPAGAGGERQFIAVVQDIDAQRAAQEELRQNHALLAIAGRMARLGGWEVMLPGRELRLSAELLDILDAPRDPLPDSAEIRSWYTAPSRALVTQAIEACLAQGTPFDVDLELVTPQQRWLSVRAIGQAVLDGAGRVIGAHGAVLDQTERKRAEQVLRESEQRFRNVARATADAIWDWNLADDRLWWSDGIQSLFGYPADELEPGIESWTVRIHPQERQRVEAGIRAVIATGGELWSDEYRFRRHDGSWAMVLDRGFVIRAEDGSALRMVGGMTDVSAQREAERRLREQATLLEAARDAISVTDLERRITYWSPGAERNFGWTRDEALGRIQPELLGEDSVQLEAALGEVLQHGQWSALLTQQHKDGRRLVADARWTLLRDADGQPSAVLAIKTDVTERLALEAQLQQAQRLEAIGQLTGGVAHDFNNLLTVLLGNAELLAERLDDRPELRSLAEMSRTAAERGAELTQRLLAFARKQPLQPQPVDAHQLLSGMDALLRRTLPENIEIELVRAAGLWPALADPVQIESAVLNLVLNARDAMPEGGKITLETGNAWIDQDYAERHADVLPGQYVLISVSDSGQGMNPEQLARAFEPFYTTKGAGKGSGLGLSMVYGFASQSRGHVKLYSEPGHGTTARLYLPRAGQPAASTAPGRALEPDLRSNATVLVVEDNELVRRHAVELLGGLGYRVLAAENGVAALAVLGERSDIDILFTDVVMPGGLNGRQLADTALALRPRLRVLYTSGYTENAIVHHGRLDRGVHLLPKPYRSLDLARKMMAVLTQPLK